MINSIYSWNEPKQNNYIIPGKPISFESKSSALRDVEKVFINLATTIEKQDHFHSNTSKFGQENSHQITLTLIESFKKLGEVFQNHPEVQVGELTPEIKRITTCLGDLMEVNKSFQDAMNFRTSI